MAQGRWDGAGADAGPVAVADVVAGLLPGAYPAEVAKAAVREALSRGARVRFLQVLAAGASAQERAAGDVESFGAALRALREAPRVPVTFEVAEGEPGDDLVGRSLDASVLVVGAAERAGIDGLDGGDGVDGADGGDGADGVDGVDGTASYCLRHAGCDVLTVRPARSVVAT